MSSQNRDNIKGGHLLHQVSLLPLSQKYYISMAIPKRLLRRRVRNQALPTEADLHRLAHYADLRCVVRLRRLRDDNMAAYEAHYPAAVAVRDQLGLARWEDLERYRARASIVSVRLRKLDRERLQVRPEDLDVFLPRIRAWILSTFGQREAARFEQLHLARTPETIPEFQRWFRDKPSLWLAYNLYFDVGVRMQWGQQMRWVVWALQAPHGNRRVKLSACDEVWNRAMVEVYHKLMVLRPL